MGVLKTSNVRIILSRLSDLVETLVERSLSNKYDQATISGQNDPHPSLGKEIIPFSATHR
jgi:hypothetical protein